MAIFSGEAPVVRPQKTYEPRKKPGEGPFPATNTLKATAGVCARNFRVPDSKFALRVFGSYKAIGRSLEALKESQN